MLFLRKNKATVLFGVLLITLLGWLSLQLVIQWLSPRPSDLGVQENRLKACPASPNCVSSYDTDEIHSMMPIPYTGSAAAAQAHLLAVLQNHPRTRIVINEPGYLQVEFRSLVWGFIDDGEFYLDESAGVIQFRSASRLGYGDSGVNRIRMEQIQAAFLSTTDE
jgi:uncharacterized protein (DUF1499 family)